MSVGCQITDGCGPRTTPESLLCRLHCDQAGMTEQKSAHTVCLSDVVCISLIASETDGHAGHCQNKQYRVPQIHYTHLSWSVEQTVHAISSQTVTYTLTYTGDAHWVALQAGLSTDCGLSYQHLGPTVTSKGEDRSQVLKMGNSSPLDVE